MRTRVIGGVAVVAAAGLVILLLPKRPPRPHRDPRFATLGETARDLAHDEKTFDLIVEQLGGGRTSYGLIGTAQKAILKRLFQAADYDGLDRQPRTTLEELGSALAVLARIRAPPVDAGIDAPLSGDLGLPATVPAPAPADDAFVSTLALGITRGDRIDRNKAPRFGDSQRLAQVLNALSLARGDAVSYRGEAVSTPEALGRLLQSHGHVVEVRDERLAANFGDLERGGHPIATPLWIDTGRRIGDEELSLPVPHAQLVLRVRGPDVNADVTLYPSLDLSGEGGGGTRFRPDLTADQVWVGGVLARVYEGSRALSALRLMGELRRVVAERVAARSLPLDGYFVLGVCTLAPAVVEQELEGRTTLWPLTHDPALFDGDTAIDRVVRRLPVDGRGGPPPEDARLAGSIPWRAGDLAFPHLRPALDVLGLGGSSDR